MCKILYYEQRIKCYVCLRCQKSLNIHHKSCNAMHVKGVKRSSKWSYTSLLNIQPVFNLKKVLESWDLGLSNHIIKCYVCWSMLEVLIQPSTPLTCFNIHIMLEKHQISAFQNIFWIENLQTPLSTPLTWVTLLCIQLQTPHSTPLTWVTLLYIQGHTLQITL